MLFLPLHAQFSVPLCSTSCKKCLEAVTGAALRTSCVGSALIVMSTVKPFGLCFLQRPRPSQDGPWSSSLGRTNSRRPLSPGLFGSLLPPQSQAFYVQARTRQGRAFLFGRSRHLRRICEGGKRSESPRADMMLYFE